jgi:hypothetical protein
MFCICHDLKIHVLRWTDDPLCTERDFLLLVVDLSKCMECALA